MWNEKEYFVKKEQMTISDITYHVKHVYHYVTYCKDSCSHKTYHGVSYCKDSCSQY